MDENNSSEVSEEQNYSENEYKEQESSSSDSDTSGSTLENGEDEDNDDTTEESSEPVTLNDSLQQRISALRDSMQVLRKQLREERDLWKQEVEETIRLSSAVRIQEEAGDEIDVISNDTYSCDNMRDFSVAEYEQKLIMYKRALAKAEIEKQASLKRQMAINNYKRRLLEVENACNLELLRVKQSVQFLQPLQLMVSEWSTKDIVTENDNCSGDAKMVMEQPVDNNKLPLPIEMFTNKLYNDMTDMFSKLTPPNNSLPQLATTSVQWQSDEFMVNSQSTVWYSGDCMPVGKFD